MKARRPALTQHMRVEITITRATPNGAEIGFGYCELEYKPLIAAGEDEVIKAAQQVATGFRKGVEFIQSLKE
jgi:hypothetical protein